MGLVGCGNKESGKGGGRGGEGVWEHAQGVGVRGAAKGRFELYTAVWYLSKMTARRRRAIFF